MKNMKKEILDFLTKIGVDNRFISLYKEFIFINHLRFSRFSRRREELFLTKFPQWAVIRSKLFQKMCVRASRSLSKSLNPGEKVFIIKNKSCSNMILYIILESYTRKYGIEIICGNHIGIAKACEVDSIASDLTLDREVEKFIQQMFNGEKIEPKSSEYKHFHLKLIYPLIHIPESWIESWVSTTNFKCDNPPLDKQSNNLLKFLEEFIPEVRENILKSAYSLHNFH